MKKFLFVAVFAFIGSLVFAQERIAVFPFEDMENVLTRNEAVMFYRQFSNEFTNRNVGRFAVVPRLEVERLINIEMAFQLTDLSARAKTAEYERVLNGTQILSGLIGRVGNNIHITVSLYTYPELQQLPGGTTLSVANKNELFIKIPELVQNMQNIIPLAYRIGDRGPGGGFIFFAENGVYMECSMDIGSHDWDNAMMVAQNYRGGGFSDWRLPTIEELGLICRNLIGNNLGGFSSGYYWSSSSYFGTRAEAMHTSYTPGVFSKNTTNTVRVVRAF
jgi:hypothetical protein